jgi:hypothetical protein
MLASEQLLIAECRTIEDGALEYHKAPAVTRSTVKEGQRAQSKFVVSPSLAILLDHPFLNFKPWFTNCMLP